MSAEQKQLGPWHVEACQTYNGRPFWAIWQRNPKRYGGQEYLTNARRTDKKRFYVEEKAEAAAKAMNRSAAQGDDRAAIAAQSKGSSE